MPYFIPGRSFVCGPVESQVASQDDLWVSGIHREHLEADVTVDVVAAVSLNKAPRWDLGPSPATVCGLIQIMVGVSRSEKESVEARRSDVDFTTLSRLCERRRT